MAPPATPDDARSHATDFVRELVQRDVEEGTFGGRVQTRFPPEPNGYLHIGHAKAITLNYELALEFGGVCNLRFDDTNPDTEETSFVEGIIADLRWLGYEPGEPFHASDYFEQLYDWAELLIGDGKAYVDDQDGDMIRVERGGYGKPGIESPYRNRGVDENLDLFRRMRAGEFADGSRVLRAKIDMQHENMQMRDPVMYRIRRGHHHHTHDAWVIYPTYDWAHGQSDAIEGVTHSLCTLEFDSHRALYDWYLDQLPLPYDQPRQTEFARLELTHTVMSKRKLATLVADGIVDGWDDPRMPTLRGLRRRGYPAAAIRDFCAFIGVARTNSRHQIELLESFVRNELNRTAQRRMAVLRPLRMVITNWPADAEGNPRVEQFEILNNPENEADGTRSVAFSGELFIEHEDFMLDPPPKFFRLAPGREVRLRGAYFVTCTHADVDAEGNVTTVYVTHDPASRGGAAPDGRKVKSTMHWVSAAHGVAATVALYERLFTAELPGAATDDPLDDLDRDSRELLTDAVAEPALADTAAGTVVQFERLGYFAHDSRQPMLFHRTVGLRDEWANIQSARDATTLRENRSMKDVVVGIAAIVIGGVFCFWGYFALRIVIPIWGFFAGFMLGAGATSFFDDSEFLSTVLGWILGFFIGLLFALIAYLFYEVAVVLAFASIGFTFGSGLMTALNIDWNWFVILVGVAVGILFGIFAAVSQLPMALLVVFSSIAGALAMTAGLMLVFNALDTEDFSNDAIVDLIDDDWWWWVIAFALVIAGLVAQMKVITRMHWTVREAWDNSWRPGPPPAIA